MAREYRVGTFPGEGNRRPHAYLRDYNPEWAGCVEFTVMASCGKEAKRLAIEERMRREVDGA